MYHQLFDKLGENDHRLLKETTGAVGAVNTILRNHNFSYVGCVNGTTGAQRLLKRLIWEPPEGKKLLLVWNSTSDPHQ